jgi:hypothetical protein
MDARVWSFLRRNIIIIKLKRKRRGHFMINPGVIRFMAFVDYVED